MKELSLNILDVAMNSVAAGASLIQILIDEDEAGEMVLQIIDNGCGMSEETLAHVTDPFYTTRTTRKVGLGIPLLKLTAEQTGGTFSIQSRQKQEGQPDSGTLVKATYHTRHIDFTPLGDIVSTLTTLIQGNPNTDFLFRHKTPERTAELDTRQLRQILGSQISLDSYEVIAWIQAYLQEQYQQ